MYGQVFGAVSQVPGLRVFPRLDPPLPNAGQYDVEMILESDLPPDQLLESVGAVVGAAWQSGKFLYADTDLKLDQPQANVVIDREQIADLGLDLAGVGRELGTLLGGAYVNRFNYYDRSYKVIPQIGDDDRATVGPLLDLKIRTPSGQLVPVSTFTRIESSVGPRSLNRFQQRNAGAHLRRRQAGHHEGRRSARDRGSRGRFDCAGHGRRLRRRVAPDPSRGLGVHGHARIRGGAHLPGARGTVPKLPRSADRAARLGAARDLGRARAELPRSHLRSTSTRRSG
jgi:multidrug efflux pump